MIANVISDDQGEMYLELPDELLETLDWHVGDTLEWDVRLNGTVYLSKKDEDDDTD
jgi:bifunctional DNA-binding transcriptional regulator/antitoxin component of YhaV-PrlF toxin-antitoxin module